MPSLSSHISKQVAKRLSKAAVALTVLCQIAILSNIDQNRRKLVFFFALLPESHHGTV